MGYKGIYEDVKDLINFHNSRDPHIILEERGVFIRPFKEPTKLLGMFKIILKDKYVFYNPNINEYNLRMVLAHELGHEYYHSNNSSCCQDIFYTRNLKEVEANVFASHLLLSNDNIKEYIELGYSIDEMAKLECVNKNFLIVKLRELMRMQIIPQLDIDNNNDFFRNIDGRDERNWFYE